MRLYISLVITGLLFTPLSLVRAQQPAPQESPSPQPAQATQQHRVSQQEIDRLKSEIGRSGHGRRAQLNGELADKLVDVADQQFAAGESVKAHGTIKEAFDHATEAHDEALHTRKKLKEVEIHLRETQRHMEVVRRTLAADDRPALEAMEKKLADYRQDLLDAMFSPKKTAEKEQAK
ncbi:MAG TPA: hypothetical protein VE783_11450 [Candidatus Limnocylindrales bacterium]|jgi:hypothetical protein|nr:hypothetical protein [Candidatus Limnocylindrales bacterium]